MKPYRKNVGIVVFNSRGRVLGGERPHYPGTFQFPQGGIDEGEEPLAAARRELYEEVGLATDEKPVFELAEWLRYDFPESIPDHLKRYQGQEQKWFFFFWDGDPASLSLDHHEREFNQLCWLSFDEMVQSVVPFKKTIYRHLQEAAIPTLQAFLGHCLCFDPALLETIASGQAVCKTCNQRYLQAELEVIHTCLDGNWVFVKMVDSFPEPMPVELDEFIQSQKPYVGYRRGSQSVTVFR